MAQFTIVLDVTIVNVAAPALRDDLGLATDTTHWVVTAYALTFGGFLLAGGRAGDLLGRRRVFCAGLALFTGASLACGLAPDAATLVLARGAQGVGAALLSPSAFGLLVAGTEGRERTRAIGVWGSVGARGATSGLVLGGALVETLGWRSVFLVNVPVGLAALALGGVLPGDRLAGRRERRLDLHGAALATAGLLALVYTLGAVPAHGLRSGPVLVAGAAAAVLLLAFATREVRSRDPLVPVAIARGAGFLVPGAVGLLHGATMLATFLLLPLYLQETRGLTALQAGAALLAVRLPAVGWARVVAWLADRVGAYVVMACGAALMEVALLSFTQLPESGTLVFALFPGLVALGLGIPALFLSVSAAALEEVRPQDASVASGLLSTLQWVGGSIGLALAAGSTADDALASVHRGFWIASALALAGLAVAVAGAARRTVAPALTHG